MIERRIYSVDVYDVRAQFANKLRVDLALRRVGEEVEVVDVGRVVRPLTKN
jgi:hypothetical protein